MTCVCPPSTSSVRVPSPSVCVRGLLVAEPRDRIEWMEVVEDPTSRRIIFSLGLRLGP